tara:strand:- start:7324 stop:7518 length:195 start_codon:yes stop_codon:yes gene_type:complete
MPKYRLSFCGDGRGYVDIEADNPKQAEDKFYDGDYDEDKWTEWCENCKYQYISKIEVRKEREDG